MKPKYYRLDEIRKRKALYNLIYGERSNGKTFAVIEEILKRYCETGEQGAIIRRWDDDFKRGRGLEMFTNLVHAGLVEKYTGGKWTDIYFQNRRWTLCCYEPETGKRILDNKPLAYAFALTASQHDKSVSFPEVTTILFDEFLSRSFYLPEEVTLFWETLSTIIRQRDNVTIYMCGNTVNKYCPYFTAMGLKHVKQMKPGDIDLYTYANSDLRVAVEYTLPNVKGKASDKYFAFDDPKLKMITTGAWEISVYPHLPERYKPKDVLFHFFIKFDGEYVHGEIVQTERSVFIYLYRKSDEIKDVLSDYVYSTEYNSLPNWHRNILKPTDRIGQKIYNLFRADKVFYSDNDVGEIVRNYVQWCRQN